MKRILRSVILLLIRILGAPGAFIAAWQAQNRHRQDKHEVSGAREHAARILLVRPDHLGDMLLVTPILQAIKERVPDAQITMMVGQWSADIVERHPAIDHVITCPFPGFQRASQKPLAPYQLLLTVARQLRRNRYDLAINLRPDFWWGGALLYLVGIPQRIGYAIAPGTPFLTQALAFPPAEHATISNLRLASAGLQALGYDVLEEPYTPARYPLYFKPTQEEQVAIRTRLQHEGITDETPLVVIHPGTGGAVKLWRDEGWSHIANWVGAIGVGPSADPVQTCGAVACVPCTTGLHDHSADPKVHGLQARIVLTGSPKERPMLEEVAQGIELPPLLMTDLTVGQLAALIARTQLALGVDNGPLHMATAQDTLSIRIYGPTDPHIFGPWGATSRHIVIAQTQKCAGCPLIPCGRLDFSPDELPTHPCVRLITEEQVERAIIALLGNQSLSLKQ
jgi:ADP-heptose:LPS heptosyltransferase